MRLLSENGGVNNNFGGVNTNHIGGVNTNDLALLAIIEKSPGLNAPTLAIALNKSLRSTQRYLKTLSDSGKIEFRGVPKKGGYYILANNEA